MDEDRSFVSTGKPEDWTYEGMKVYNYMRYFKDKNTFVETFLGEDGLEYSNETPRQKWTDEIKNFAKEKGIL